MWRVLKNRNVLPVTEQGNNVQTSQTSYDFVSDLLASFTVDFITQNNLTPTCIMHLA